MNKREIKQRLIEMSENPTDSIEKEVAKEALSHSHDNPLDFFNDVLTHGCVSGMVSILIYYRDTHAFFQKYYDEIEDIRNGYEEQTGLILQPKGDLMNWYSWFAFEEVARQVAESFGVKKEVEL